MKQLTLNIENAALVPLLTRLVAQLNGVTIVKPDKRRSSYEKALDDAQAGRVVKCSSLDDCFNKLGI